MSSITIRKGIEKFSYDQEVRNSFYENKESGVYYNELKCPRCHLRFLLKGKKISFFKAQMMSDGKDPEPEKETLTMSWFQCVNCDQTRWPIVDDVEIIDVY
jgi:DNA-directed RNA polymerase subunit RPC12/RpoP